MPALGGTFWRLQPFALQLTPPRYQSRGYGGAAPVALPLQLPLQQWSGPWGCGNLSTAAVIGAAGALVLLLSTAIPRPVTNLGAMAGAASAAFLL